MPMPDIPSAVLDAARAGDPAAAEELLRGLQPMVHRLALSFFGCPHHADDATQEVLLKVVRGLAAFDGRSAVATWAYRIAVNTCIDMRRSRAEMTIRSDDDFAADLARQEPAAPTGEADRMVLIEEVRVGCTLAMLLCLGREDRLAYILGEIAGLDHRLASDLMGSTTAAFRKRLQRARERLVAVMRAHCGVFSTANPCRCQARISTAIARGRVDPARPLLAGTAEQARQVPDLMQRIRRLEEVQRVAAIYASHPEAQVRTDLAELVHASVASP